MTVDRFAELATAIHNAVVAAVPGVPVSNSPLKVDRYIRIDGNVITPLEAIKNYRQANHAFLVHAFDSPTSDNRTLSWVGSALIDIDAVLRALVIPSGHSVILEQMTAGLEPRGDGQFDAHAFSRYRVQLGEN